MGNEFTKYSYTRSELSLNLTIFPKFQLLQLDYWSSRTLFNAPELTQGALIYLPLRGNLTTESRAHFVDT
jgi:hypothetical protein